MRLVCAVWYFLGLTEGFLTKCATGKHLKPEDQANASRFMLALLLKSAVSGKRSVWKIARDFSVDRGTCMLSSTEDTTMLLLLLQQPCYSSCHSCCCGWGNFAAREGVVVLPPMLYVGCITLTCAEHNHTDCSFGGGVSPRCNSDDASTSGIVCARRCLVLWCNAKILGPRNTAG